MSDAGGNRLGLAADRLPARPASPWYRRPLPVALLAAVVSGIAAWLAAMQWLGGTRPADPRVGELERQLAELRSGGGVGEAALQIERTTQERLARHVRELETENGRLKEDLALFERLATLDGSAPGVTLSGLHVEADTVPRQYRFRLLAAVRGAKKEREFNGMLQIIVGIEQAGRNTMIVLPGRDAADRQRYAVAFRHFRRIDGSFQIPEGARLTSLEVRLLQDGTTRASESVQL